MKNATTRMTTTAKHTMGIDLGNHYSWFCLLDEAGQVIKEARTFSSVGVFETEFSRLPPMRVVIEAGSSSPWASRVLAQAGHEVIVANPRKVRAIYQSDNKTDRLDAETLARLGRVDPKLLAPIQHRSAEAQADLALIRARHALVRARTLLANHVRGAVKSFGGRIPPCAVEGLPYRAPQVPQDLRPALAPLLDTVASLTAQIRKLDRELEALARTRYPETAKLRAVNGVGPLTSLAFLLTIDDATRFKRSRDVGAYLGLRPRHDESGDAKKQLGISKAGDPYLRQLLVNCAHYILGPFARDSELRRHGLELARRGARNGKKRAVVAVARKLAVLLHRLLTSDVPYDPEYNTRRRTAKTSTPNAA